MVKKETLNFNGLLTFSIQSLLMIWLIIDTINGFLQRTVNSQLGISPLIKSIYILLILIYVIRFKSRIATNFLLSILLFFLLFLYHFLISKDSVGLLKYEIPMIFRYLIVPATFTFFFIRDKCQQINRKKIWTIIWVNFFVVVINLILGILGYGYSQYEGKIGSVGYFIAGNEVSGVLLVFSFIVLIHTYTFKSRFRYFVYSAGVILLSIIKATKVAIIGCLFAVFIIPFRRTNKITYFVLSSILFVISGFIVYQATIKIGLYDRIIYYYNQTDLISLLLSNRNLVVEKVVSHTIDSVSFFNLLFGGGYPEVLNSFNNASLLRREINLIEIDFIDLFLEFGLVGIILIGYWWGQILVIVRKNFYLVILLWLLIIISNLSGHIIYSGLLSPFIGMLPFVNFDVNEIEKDLKC